MQPARDPATGGTVDSDEVAAFARIAARWWDPDGPFRPLHRLNPVRLAFIRDRLLRHFAREPASLRPFAGLRLLDIGCGGGLVAEPMARLGFTVTAIDADEAALAAGRAHAAAAGLAIDYRAGTVEALVAAGASFDAVLALEVVEHVADPQLFLASAAALLRPGGALIASTLNRSLRAFLFGVVGAEYVLRWLPRGTHDWRKFRRPSELAAALRAGGLSLVDLAGLVYEPWRDAWRLGPDLGVNYLLIATKPAGK